MRFSPALIMMFLRNARTALLTGVDSTAVRANSTAFTADRTL